MSDDENREVQEEIGAPQEPQEDNHPSTKAKGEPQKTYISILKADPLYNEVSQILHWKDPVRTGLIFGIINLFYVLHECYDYTFLTLISYLALALAVVTMSYANFVVWKARWVQGKEVENPFTERFKNENFHIAPQTVEKHLNTVVDLVNLTVDHLRDVFYAADNLKTALWAFYFYVTATIGEWFEGATILYLVTLISFIWPRLYTEKKKEIDHMYSVALVECDKYLQLALSKLPPAVIARFPFLAPKDKKTK